MSFPEKPEDTDWFAKGWAVYKGDIRNDDPLSAATPRWRTEVINFLYVSRADHR